jgi:predicted outer membrane repeat protein
VVEDCTFLQNAALGFSGGAIHAAGGITLRDSALALNESERFGGAIYGRGSIQGCTISNNLVRGSGGGAYLFGGRIEGCDIVSNQALDGFQPARGGGLYTTMTSAAGLVTVLGCRIWNNDSTAYGGGIFGGSVAAGIHTLSVINSSIAGNSAAFESGGGISIGSDGSEAAPLGLKMTGCILWGNAHGAGLSGELAQVHSEFPLEDFSFTTIQGLASYAGPALSGQDPLFVAPTVGNLRLASGSPCIDAGFDFVDTNPLMIGIQPLPPTDLDGQPRIVDGDGFGGATVDQGAYEVQL